MTRRDLAVLVAGAVCVCGTALDGRGPVGALSAALLVAALALYPRAAAPAAALAVAATALSLPAGELSAWAVLLVAANAFCAGRHTGGAGGLAAAAALLVLAQLKITDDGAVPMVLVPGALYLCGHALRGRDELARQLAERAADLEAEREVYSEMSVRYERSRIAAELHDIVAHAISVMVVQASAGQRLADRDPQLTADTFAAIGEAARQAEADMGRLVALLAEEEAPAGETPDLTLVRELVARAAGSGLDVTLGLKGDREQLPEAVVHSAYLVVREALTNALRYASGAPVRVRVDGRPDQLVVEVVNGPAPRAAALADHGTGNGLRGLRERLDEAGGRLDAGATPDGGWRVLARVPRRAPALQAS
ncbi:MAG: sensor histidine kinase [Solirubrobacteraceae bacterium]